jgi:nicotinamidase-related amidase
MGRITFEEIIRLVESPYPDFEIKPGKTALILIDMQRFVLGKYYVEHAVKAGIDEEAAREAVKEYDERVKKVVENVGKLLGICRKKGFDIIHVRILAPTANPRHTAKVNRKIGLIVPPGSEGSEFIDEVKPLPGEVVISKTNGGALSGTNLDFILRNMDIDSLIIVGFLTDQCVLATAIHAADLGYDVLLLEDACTTRSKELHEATLMSLKDVAAKVKTTEEVIKIIEKLSFSE